MTQYMPVVVPAVPPKPPPLNLVSSSVRPGNGSDPGSPVFEVGPDQLAILPGDLRAELQARKGDSWIRGITYAPENHWAAENRGPFDQTSADTPALAAPTGLTLTQGTGGSLSNATYSYQVTAVNANGQTTALAATTIVVAAGGGTASVKLAWKGVAAGVTYNIYGRVGGAIGLLATVGPFDRDNPPGWTDLGSIAPGAAPPVSNTTAGLGSYTNLAIVTCIPWTIIAEDSCSTWGFEERDFKGRAQRLLANSTPRAIESEFWTGTIATANSLPNNYLCNTSAPNFQDVTPGAGAPSVARGQQILQDLIASSGFGGQAMIHVQPQTAPNLLNARRVGGLLLDIFDNVVVPGTGYTGVCSAIGTPAAGTAVMFATDLVMTRVEDTGIVYPDTFAEALDRGQAGQPNRITFRAQKFGCAYFDGAIQAGIRVTLAT